MNRKTIRDIADAVLYEGYMLYPYRPTSVKNRQRWTFGGLLPEPYAALNGEPSTMQAEVLIQSDDAPSLEIEVRFLHLLLRDDGLEMAVAREAGAGYFEFAGDQKYQQTIRGVVNASTQPIAAGLHRLTLRIANQTAAAGGLPRDQAMLHAMVSTHAILYTSNGEFVSLMDPADRFREAAGDCKNVGLWPVLAGDAGSHDCMLASPIILYDYPEVAPESAGELFDGTEIDEILNLRILTMTDGEKRQMRAGDDRTRRILERAEAMTQKQQLQLHGAWRHQRPSESAG